MKKPKGDERTLPHSLESERAVLGAILMHSDAYDAAAAIIDRSDFFRDAHGRIFAAMARLADAHQPIEFITLREDLQRSGDLDDVGGPTYLSALVDGMPRSTNIAHYAAIVLEKSRLRATIKTATALTAAAYDGAARASELADDAVDRLRALGGSSDAGAAVLLADLVSPGITALEQSVAKSAGGVTGLPTGFVALDDMTSGLQNGDLVLVAARTSQGKTALAMNLARYIGASVPVLVFSLEMSKTQLFMRLLASEARVDSHRIRTGNLADADWTRIGNAIAAMGDLRIFIDDTGGLGVREVLARARAIKNKHGLGAIVVDYIQLLKGRGMFDNRTQEIGTITRGLKAVARELDVPIVGCAQLSRAAEPGPGRKARRPQLSDLGESGSLENDADVVLLIYRPEPKDDDPDNSNLAEVIVAKQRNGPTGIVRLAWNKSIVRFENVAMV